MSTPENDVIEALRNARPSEPDVRHLIGDTLKKLSINGKNVTGSGLSFTVGNTGLGVEDGEASGTPASEPLQTVEISPPLPVEQFLPPAPSPLQLVTAPEVAKVLEPSIAPAPPVLAAPEAPDIPAPLPPPPAGLLSLVVTGAVNGVPATATVAAYAPWSPIE